MKKYDKPTICYPTILLFIISLIFTILGILINCINLSYLPSYILIILSLIQLILSIIIISFSCYSQFTVIHEASHSNISKNRYLNDIIGLIASFWLGPTGNWYGFKFHHLDHHTYTNNINLDPDMWCSDKGFGGKKLILFRWMTLDYHYIYCCFKSKSRMSSYYMKQIIIEFIIKFIMAFIVYYYFGFNNVLLFWVIPSRLSITLLAFAFDYLPHYPHDVKKNENKYLTTSYISCPWFIKLLLSPIAFYQDYHIIHHLNTQIPFYKYSSVWEQEKKDLLTKIRINKLFPEIFGEENLDDQKDIESMIRDLFINLNKLDQIQLENFINLIFKNDDGLINRIKTIFN